MHERRGSLRLLGFHVGIQGEVLHHLRIFIGSRGPDQWSNPDHATNDFHVGTSLNQFFDRGQITNPAAQQGGTSTIFLLGIGS